MHFGNLNNAQILMLIDSGQVSYGDTVFSTDFNELFTYNGTLFKSKCGCFELGTKPSCDNPGNCDDIVEAYATFDDTFEP